MKLKQVLSPKALLKSLRQMTYRFPIAVVLLVLLTIFLSYMACGERLDDNTVTTTLFFLCGGILLDYLLSLWGEEQSSPVTKKRYWIIKASVLAVWTVYCGVLYVTHFNWERNVPFIVGNVAWLVAVLAAIPFVAYLREKDDVKSWHFIFANLRAYIISLLVAAFMDGGLLGLLYGTAALFRIPTRGDTVPLVLTIISLVLIQGVLFFALVPSGERKHNTSTEMSKFLRNTVSWLFIPLLGAYMLVLYVYTVRILITWNLPEGLISYLVSAVMAMYVLCYFLLYPQIKEGGTWQAKLLTRWLPIAILPLLVLMTVAVGVRIGNYGITELRLYLATVLAWFYAVCIGVLVSKTKRFRWIYLSFAAIFILSSGQPLNYFFITKKVMMHKVDKLIAEKNAQLPFPKGWGWMTGEELAAQGCNLTRDEIEEICELACYLNRYNGYDTEEYFSYEWKYARNDDEEAAPQPFYRRNIYFQYDGTMTCPKGPFTTFRFRNSYAGDVESHMNKIKNGVLPLYDNYSETTLLIDTAAMKYNYEHDLPMVIPSREGTAAFVPESIEISVYSDSTLSVHYVGYLFMK